MLHFGLSPQQQQLRLAILAAAQELPQAEISSGPDADATFRHRWQKSGELELIGLCIEPEYGGRGLSALDTAIALEAIGEGSADAGFNFALAAHLLACLVPIQHHASADQKRQWLPALCNGQAIATNAMTEQSAGSDVFQMNTTAVTTAAGFHLNGHKTYASNAPVADIAVTYALTNPEKGFFGGITAFVLEKAKGHFRSSTAIQKTGLISCQLGEVFLDNISVNSANQLGQEGAGGQIFNQSMNWERICLSALHLGAMQRLIERAVRFASKRKSQGQSISKFQAVSHPLASLQCRISAGRQLLWQAAWKMDQGQKVQQEAAMVKLFISETYRDFGLQLVQLYGGEAYKAGHEAETCLRNALASTLYSGTSEVQKNIIARNMGMR